VQVSEVQRSRMLHSAVQVISEVGYREMSVARVTGRAGVSRRTFYDLFDDREDCFLAVFDDAVARVAGLVGPAYEREQKGWRERVRCALAVLLSFLDGEPGVCSLLVVDALGAGPRVLERRAEILAQLGVAVQEGGFHARGGRGLPPMTGEGVVGAVFSVIHTRVSQQQPGSMVELLGPLMGMIVLPYLGSAAAQRELERPVPKVARAPKSRSVVGGSMGDPLTGLSMRVTYRTLRVLDVIAGHPGVSNRWVAGEAGVADQGQISKLLTRLERLGLIHNAAGEGSQPSGEPNAWALTARGVEVQQALQPQPSRVGQLVDGVEGSR
jgi:AcrR family transcriptional regulator